jgi:alcohol/geraniol dehydrogenase (NADP+)
MISVNAFAATEAGGKLKPFKYELPDSGSDQVDIQVHYCEKGGA